MAQAADDQEHVIGAAGPGPISVIICAYTIARWDELEAAVQSVLNQTLPPHEITVVIDGNPDLLAQAKEHFEGIAVAANQHGAGLSGARNTGADLSSGAVLAFLDDDGVAGHEWLEEHAKAYISDDVLGVGGDVFPLWRAEKPAWLPKELYWVIGCSYTGLPEEPAEIRNPIGANMSIRAEIYKGAGGFQHALGRRDTSGKAITGTADETEFCIRASAHYPQGRWIYQPKASIHHVVTPDRTTWRYFEDRCRLEAGSKAVLTKLQGQRQGLSSERRYVTRVLPKGLIRELTTAARGDIDGLKCAYTIIAALSITSYTYFRARSEMALGRGQKYFS